MKSRHKNFKILILLIFVFTIIGFIYFYKTKPKKVKEIKGGCYLCENSNIPNCPLCNCDISQSLLVK